MLPLPALIFLPSKQQVLSVGTTGWTLFAVRVLETGIPSDSFDVVTVIGGIHHTPPYEIEAIEEIHRILKPRGHFCFMEPHSESIAEVFRKTWYKYDPLFAKNEAAVSMKRLHSEFADRFDFKSEQFLGNVGYLLVLNSMVFRIPPVIKRAYSPVLIAGERLLNRVLGKPFLVLWSANGKRNDSLPITSDTAYHSPNEQHR